MNYLKSIAVMAVFLTATTSAIAQVRKSETRFTPRTLGMTVPVITSHKDLDRHLGHMVAVRGKIAHTKAPTILGVDVRNPENLDDVDAYAVGILTRHELTADDHAKLERDHGPIASRGPGVTYSLYFDLSGKLSDARSWPESKSGR